MLPTNGGWTIYAHPLFLDQLESYREEYRRIRHRFPDEYKKKRATKLYAALLKVIFEVIPSNPAAEAFRQGNTLGALNKNWFRAKFLQQYRVFFRFAAQEKVIVLAWVNDDDSKRAYESGTDAYAVFRKMLADGNPPSDWEMLKKTASDPAVLDRWRNISPPEP
ncbi:type II toxin-antitoxin system YhaV family toxin [Microvirga pudoricolor]|uniref:type II toxin-antitoxin system YhaV family toxin n=1 Tax=Microvirga pudoricolor TaxID=2778729 RepID=UPI001951C463|nr:type II toxin-antitoxin system YhaV family toxin [Microvirga pudoricolor]MBM6594963.1 type II toxin-antitoxin system YhaV family toxin [Microvirga pudoricolor]